VAVIAESQLSHYRLLRRIGEGGMGEVWLARDLRLGRQLAIKTLRPDGDDDSRRRLLSEAQAASALNHPHIVTVYDIGRDDAGRDFIAMEHIDGEPLSARLSRGEHGVGLALEVGLALASALAAAHAAGIIHRDVKPGNVMSTPSGQIKLLDFGLAKRDPSAIGPDDLTCAPPATAEGVVSGTPAYMAPEQIEGVGVSAHTDVFALGLLLFELACGRRAFVAPTPAALLVAILRDQPPPLARDCPDCPPALARLVAECLARQPTARPTSAEVLRRLQAMSDDWRKRHTVAARLRRPMVAWPLAGVLLVALAAGLWVRQQQMAGARVLDDGLREIEALVTAERRIDAFAHVLGLRRQFPDDPRLAQWWEELGFPVDLVTTPPGARLRIKPYTEPDADWIELGYSDQPGARVPAAHVRWSVEAEGHLPLVLALSVPPPPLQLTPIEDAVPGMRRVDAGTVARPRLPVREVGAFWLGETEVTNAEYQRFVDDGGYRNPEWWSEPFIDGDVELGFGEAIARFKDATGRTGPAGWELGRHVDGAEQLPVSGISWYEASAYAAWAGARLPSAWHWLSAAAHSNDSDVLALGNFESSAVAAVGSRRATSPYGHEDLAGNVAEWTATRRDGAVLIMGGHWRSLGYLFNDYDGADPWTRNDHIGLRIARIDGDTDPAFTEAPPREQLEYGEPVGDDVFNVLLRFYASEPAARPGLLEGEQSYPHWRLQRWRIPTAYADGGFRLWLYLPHGAAPPYQTVLYAPTSSAQIMSDSALDGARDFAWIVRSGRAVAFPVFFDTYERRLPADVELSVRRTARMRWSQDAARVIDLLQAHPDLDTTRLAFVGYSLGAQAGMSMLAVEPRFKAGVLIATGLHPRVVPPELDLVNFLPRIRQPVLLVGGADDFINPVQTSQRPLFDRLTGAAAKQHYIFQGGHVPSKHQEVIGVVLDWLDRHLDPVDSPAP
jgi:eukaryotic-like serine/threonine-protein kinase